MSDSDTSADRATGDDQATDDSRHAGPAAMLSPLREYAVLADGHRGAVVGPDGDWLWLCAPGWADGALLARLVGGGSTYRVSPVESFVPGGHYADRSMIWNHRWTTTSGRVTSREALAYPGDPDRLVGLRRLRASYAAEVEVALDLAAGFGDEPMQVQRQSDGSWAGRCGDLHVRWTGVPEARPDRSGVLRARLRLDGDDARDLVLEVSRGPLPPQPDADRLWAQTERAWPEAVPRVDTAVAARDATLALAVLTGLTRPGGGMVAAATMALPEKARAGRSFDYRYSWIRDQCYAGIAAAHAGSFDLLDAAVGFVTARLLEDGDQLKPAYTVAGGRVPDEHSLSLPGFPGGHDVVGNWVNDQFQLDAPGEALQLLATAAAHGRLDEAGREAVEVATRVIDRCWQQPDAGIWELQPRWWSHSRLACVAGLRSAADEAAPPRQAERMRGLADTLLAETSRRCLAAGGHWQRADDDPRPDAALLLPPVRGALPADDPRTVATLDAVRRQLGVDGYVYRYQHGDHPLGETEGAFLLCGFVTALAELHQGDATAGRARFERNRSSVGTPGLMAEEFDLLDRQLRGNLPQAFVHAMLLETALALPGT